MSEMRPKESEKSRSLEHARMPRQPWRNAIVALCKLSSSVRSAGIRAAGSDHAGPRYCMSFIKTFICYDLSQSAIPSTYMLDPIHEQRTYTGRTEHCFAAIPAS